MLTLLPSLPSPASDHFRVGPLRVTFYGVCVAAGLALGFWVTIRRWRARGGDVALGERVGIYACVAGFAGARIAYVSTHSGEFAGNLLGVFAIWRGGIAIYGGILTGAVTAAVLLRRAGADTWAFADSAAVGLPLAQAVGRWGNWFNQELFGTPTDLPWALRISAEHRPPEYAATPTFHPTFLYESLWSLAVVATLLVLERRFRPAKGNLFVAYVGLYGLGRFLLELLRTDTTWRFLAMSRNGWVAAVSVVAALSFGVLRQRRAARQGTDVYGRLP